MLTIAHIAGGGSQYYLAEAQQTSDYYFSGGSNTCWGGGAKEALGLGNGPVERKDFDALMLGHVSDDGKLQAPEKQSERKHDPGRDLTFSNPKSISILMQGPLKEDIRSITRNALDKAMSYAEKNFVRTRIKGDYVGDQKVIWAAIEENTSRANDPNNHAHVVLFNKVLGEDGKFRAMNNQLIYENQILLGQIYRAELAKGIREIGFTTEPVGEHGQWEVKEVPQEVRELFSKRRAAILSKITPANDTARAREAICIATRPSKQNLSSEVLSKLWNQELSSLGTSFEALSSPQKGQSNSKQVDIDKEIKTTIDIKAETEEFSYKYELYRHIMGTTDAQFTIENVEASVTKMIKSDYLRLSEDGNFLARSKDQRKNKIIKNELQKGHLQSKQLVKSDKVSATINGSYLKADQKAAISLFTGSVSRYVKIQGHAGAGKTTALETAIPLIKQGGYRVVGLAPTKKSEEALEKTGVFDKVMTLQKFLITPEGDKRTVLVVDESSLIGRDQMLSLVQFTNKKEFARVLFQGDENQMDGVQAGMPFKNMEDAGVRSVKIDEIIRQKTERHRVGITQLAEKNVREAFKTLAPEIREVDKENMLERTVEAWAQTKNQITPVIVQTNKQKDAVNAAIKTSLSSQSRSGPSVNLRTWQAIHRTDIEKSIVKYYRGASHIRFNRNYKRFKISKGYIYKLTHIDENRSELHLQKNGETFKFNPAGYKMGKGAVELYKQVERTLSIGDRIKFTRGDRGSPTKKNDMGFVTKIQNNRVEFSMDRKKTIELSLDDKEIRHIDHAWASTAHSYQGETVDHAVILMPSHRSPLTSLNSLYTGVSRHRISVSVITDNANRLKMNIERDLKIKDFEAKISWPDHEARQAKALQDKISLTDKTKNSHESKMPIFSQIRNNKKTEQKIEIDHSVGMGM